MQYRTEPDTAAQSGARFTGWHMLMIMVAFFGTVITVNGYMAYEASTSWTGLIVKNGYVASQDYNHQLAEAQAQAARGWHGDIGFADGVVAFTLTDRDGNPVKLTGVSATVGRPAFDKDDHTLSLAYAGNARYEAADALAQGPWAITVTGQSSEGPYRLEKRIFVKGQ